MPVAFVQSKSISSTGATSTTIAVTMTSAVTVGNLLAVFVAYGDTGFISCADNLGNTYTPVDNSGAAFSGDIARTFYAKITSGGTCTVTVTLSPAVGYRQLVVHEVSGVDTTTPNDKHIINKQTAPGTGANAVTSTAQTTTTNGQYIFGAARICNVGTSKSLAQGTGFTSRENIVGGSDASPLRSEDQIQTTAGSIAATFTGTGIAGDNALVALMTFIAAGGAAATPKKPGAVLQAVKRAGYF